MTDHDQLFKVLLKEFLEDFFRLFFPEWAERFDFSHVEWLEQEVFPDPPEGRRRVLDLVAKLPTREPIGAESEWVTLIHIEISSAESAVPQRRYMYRAFNNLRDRHELPVFPVAVYLRVGLEGIGIDIYEEHYGSWNVVHFEFLYVGLPALDGVEYLEKGNDLGVALAALMKVPRDKRPWFKAEALERLARSEQAEQAKYLLSKCVETYLPLEQAEQAEFEQLLTKEEYREAKTMTVTYYEQGLQEGQKVGWQKGWQEGQEIGLQKGLQEGLQEGQRQLVAVLLEDRFGPLSEAVRERLAQWPADELTDLARRVPRADSLRELGLEE